MRLRMTLQLPPLDGVQSATADAERFPFGGDIATIVSGTRSVTRAFPCNDPRIVRLERNMLSLYDR